MLSLGLELQLGGAETYHTKYLRTFAYAAPCVWNSLPTDLKDYNLSLAVFKCRLCYYYYYYYYYYY